MNEIVSHTVAFLLGTLTGAAGSCLGNKYTDKRRAGDKQKDERRRFEEVRKQMPELIAEMASDISDPQSEFVREFFVTRKEYSISTSQRRFFYYENDHENLQGKIHVLENLGYVVEVTPGNAPIFRMSEEFVKLLLGTRRCRQRG